MKPTEQTYSIDIDHEHKIILYRHSGIIKKEDIGKAWEKLLNLKEFTEKGYNLLTDYRNAIFDMEIADIQLISNHLIQLKSILKGKKQAFIIDQPINTALSILFKGEVYKQIGFIVRTFSTEESALEWLNWN